MLLRKKEPLWWSVRMKTTETPLENQFVPADANPNQIALCWKRVALAVMPNSLNADQSSSDELTRPQMPPPNSTRKHAAATDATTASEPAATSRQKRAKTSHASRAIEKRGPEPNTTTLPRSSGPSHPEKFRKEVLTPCGIVISGSKARWVDPNNHFARGPQESLDSFHSPIVLRLDDGILAEIVDQFFTMTYLHCNEQSFSSYACKNFFPPLLFKLKMSEECKWQPALTQQLACPEFGEDHGREKPPTQDESNAREYSWDLRPDCAYWITMEGFALSDRLEVKTFCYIPNGFHIFSNYLTIEFKREDATQAEAEGQVAAAGAISLYNRFLLCKRVEDDSGRINESWPTVLHYGITLAGALYCVWVLRPRYKEGCKEWVGCQMEKLATGRCDCKEEVLKFVDWINQIHHWAFSKFIEGVKQDVMYLISAYPS